MSTSATLPKNWPKEIKFIKECKFHPSLDKSQLPSLSSLPLPLLQKTYVNQSPHNPPCPSPLVSIRPITDPSHPAYPQFGLFALKKIKPNTLIMQYTGLVSPSSLASDSSNYTLSFLKSYTIDAETMGNQSRFMNDYRGVPDPTANATSTATYNGPCVAFDEYWDADPNSAGFKMGIFTIKEIRKGQEILINYGKGFWKSRGLLQSEFEY
jgi:hypothetical protein